MCFELACENFPQPERVLHRREPMKDSRKYMVLLCLNKPHLLYSLPTDETTSAAESSLSVPEESIAAKYTEKFIYAIGGITRHSVGLKTIEKYDVSRNRWT
jgi:hypothetical protein